MNARGLVYSSEMKLLPPTIGLFPLEDTVLLPHGRMPLRVFEPRYLSLVHDSLETEHRLIGIVQPAGPSMRGEPRLHSVGCAGRIKAIVAKEEDRMLIFLEGHCRFTIAEELEGRNGYRRVRPEWESFVEDLSSPDEQASLIDRSELRSSLQNYLGMRGMRANWELIGSATDIELLTSLVMMCPFSSAEKQALLESGSDRARASRLLEILQEDGGEGRTVH
ncbi:MAG: LON peptidase substrate-binding domain-containing protein [Betaproteobacteria bacterium AqS2]|uniref:LON peptidase substrate-binding domain-containing protein n=1 Tax=Candidatus Amphirhobacter heronislandensis TaxID=1732024 RepID=A0A930UCK6_9GAMM|nr:LON peptidase substrate-binding domain-containing protein [Betaproteobacteria bacterium AqS2]